MAAYRDLRAVPLGEWGLINSVSASTGLIELYYEPLPDRPFVPVSSTDAHQAVKDFVFSQRGWADDVLLKRLSALGNRLGVQFVQHRPSGGPAHVQAVVFSTGPNSD
jgi:hypothetical protein